MAAADHAELHSTATTRLRRDGQRYTAGRRALVDALVTTDRPLTILEVLEARRDLAQSSAYRNLAVLERAGVVRRIVTTDEHARFELAEDLSEHHHHLICSRCGVIEDVTVPGSLEIELERTLRRVASRRGFAGASHRLDLIGTCARCSS